MGTRLRKLALHAQHLGQAAPLRQRTWMLGPEQPLQRLQHGFLLRTRREVALRKQSMGQAAPSKWRTWMLGSEHLLMALEYGFLMPPRPHEVALCKQSVG